MIGWAELIREHRTTLVFREHAAGWPERVARHLSERLGEGKRHGPITAACPRNDASTRKQRLKRGRS